MTRVGLEIQVLPGEYAVWQLPADALLPRIEGAGFLSVTRTPDEVSVVSPADSVPAGVPAETEFRCLAVAGPLAFNLTGVVAGLSTPLAEAKVPIFVISTFDTDYLLVRSEDLSRARRALTAAGFQITDR